MLLGPLFDCLPRRHFILPILIAQMYRQPVAEPFVHLVYASAQTRKEGSGVNGPAPSVTVAFGELRTNGERTESRRGVVSRAAFRPRGDHPVRAPVPALQAQLPRSGRDDVSARIASCSYHHPALGASVCTGVHQTLESLWPARWSLLAGR